MEISKILAKYDTDKVKEHTYGIFYDYLFQNYDREKPINLLEIGTYKGESLKAWREIFPNAKITGIDIVDMVENKDPSINYIIQDIKEFKPTEEYYIIIDDGSHWLRDIVPMVNNCVYKLKKNGIMIIEDVQGERLWVYLLTDLLAPNLTYNKGYDFKVEYWDNRAERDRIDDFIILITRQ